MDLETMTNGIGSDKDTLYMLGGVALIVFGTGLILSNPFVRRQLAQGGRPRRRVRRPDPDLQHVAILL